MATAGSRRSALSERLSRLADLPAVLVGPIFTKELRVSSRRRRNFALRGIYLGLLTGFVLMIWLGTVRWESGRSQGWRIYQLALAGREIIAYVVWFQFVLLQIVAVVMLSTSVSEEIYHRTLGVLMTTPIYATQVVVGKVLSKLLQLLTLLAMSLPVLAVVRVLGGVPWDFVVSGMFITLAALLFVASLTMLFSIFFRRAFVTILTTFGAMLVLFGLVPFVFWMAALYLMRAGPQANREMAELLGAIMLNTNPYTGLAGSTVAMLEPRAAAQLAGLFHWWIPCLIMLGLSAVLLLICVLIIRRVALRQAAGETGAGPSSAAAIAASPARPAPPLPTAPPAASPAPIPPPEAPPPPPAPPTRTARVPPDAPVRRVTGSPVIWRELRATRKGRLLIRVLLAVGGLLLLGLYFLVAAIEGGFLNSEPHTVFVGGLVGIAAIATGVLAATCITSEKEANSWPILLCTTLSSWQIVAGKVVGILRRSLPIWLVAIGHVVFFLLLGPIASLFGYPVKYMHPAALLHIVLVTISVLALLAGSGLYFGARFRRTTTAVIVNLALVVVLWLAVPGLLAILGEAMPSPTRREMEDAAEYVFDVNPVVQASLAADAASGRRANKPLGRLRYHWPGISAHGFGETTAYLAATTAGYIVLGALLAWLAKRRIRRKVY